MNWCTLIVLVAFTLCPRAWGAAPVVHVAPVEASRTVALSDVSFAVGEEARNLVPGVYPTSSTLGTLVLAGMTTERPEASERWGMAEPQHAYQGRLFIGDRVGRVLIRYSDDTLEQVPILFGVNLWPYELFTPVQDGERALLTTRALKSGPYREPFASDVQAAGLLTASLHLLENEGAPKRLHYLMGLRLRSVPLRSVELIDEGLRTAGWQVGAMTGLAPGVAAPDGLEVLDEAFFMQQRHGAAAEALARRLYQYADALPDDLTAPAARAGYPQVWFEGPREAEILAHVFAENARDLVENKLTSDSRLCSSSPGSASFGGYIGMGTWRAGVGQYAHHSWSRDAGPALRELLALGRDAEARAAGETLLHFLYDGDERHGRPNWKRVINATAAGEGAARARQRAENDGHAAIMLAMAQLATSPAVDRAWMDRHWPAFVDAGDWFPWQMAHPEVSAFDGLLYNESESSGGGGRDLFSNAQAALALRAFATLAESRDAMELAGQWHAAAEKLERAIEERLTLAAVDGDALTPRYVDTDVLFDGWAYGWKRMAPLLARADLAGLDGPCSDAERRRLANTYAALRGSGAQPPDAGRTLGYGQAWLAQSALLLDHDADATRAVERAAAFCYHRDRPFIVPEGVIVDPEGGRWFRNGDQGNLMQQVEILKMIRLVIGIDDRASTMGLTLTPRLPAGWSALEVKDWPVRWRQTDGTWARARVDFHYERLPGNGYALRLRCARPLAMAGVRIGPYARPRTEPPTGPAPATQWRWSHEGDAWFLRAGEFAGPVEQLDWELP